MDTIHLAKKEFRTLVIGVGLVPTTFFVAGLFTALSLNLGMESRAANRVAEAAMAPEAYAASNVDTTSPPSAASNPESFQVSKSMPPAVEKRYLVQVGMFAKADNALKFQRDLSGKGIATEIIRTTEKDQALYRVLVASYASEREAKNLVKESKDKFPTDLYVAAVPAEVLD